MTRDELINELIYQLSLRQYNNLKPRLVVDVLAEMGQLQFAPDPPMPQEAAFHRYMLRRWGPHWETATHPQTRNYARDAFNAGWSDRK